MLPVQFVYLAACINLCATSTFAYATLRGHTQPNRVTWFIWGLAPLIATAAQLSSGVGLSTLMVFMTSLGPTLVFLCSFVNKNAYWKIDTLDYLCGALAVAGLIGWKLSSNPSVAIAFSIIADFLAALPTLRKAVTAPQSESALGFLLAVISTSIGALCVQTFTFNALGFIFYLVVINTTLCVTISRHRILRILGSLT